jgi:hypothetical protein
MSALVELSKHGCLASDGISFVNPVRPKDRRDASDVPLEDKRRCGRSLSLSCWLKLCSLHWLSSVHWIRKRFEFEWSFFLFNQFPPSSTSGKTGRTHNIWSSLIIDCHVCLFGLNHSDLPQRNHSSISGQISITTLALLIECHLSEYQQWTSNILQIHAG